MKRRTVTIGSVALAALALVGVVAARSRGPKPAVVQTGKVAYNRIVQKVNATGKIQPRTQVEISADVSARIVKLAVVDGQHVEKGAFLVELDRERYLAAVESAEANVRAAEDNANVIKENLNHAEQEYNRSRQLRESNLETQADFETKQAAFKGEQAHYRSAQAQAAQATAALKQARDDLSKTTIYAPMSGTICRLNKEPGEIALGSQFQKDVILVVADLSEMEARVDVDENDIASMAIGQKAEIEVDAMPGQRLNGVVTEIANSANDSGTGTADQKTEFQIKIRIIDPPKTLRPGMTASADVITRVEDRALSVPIQSVAVRSVDQLMKKGEKRKDAEARFKADKDGFVEAVFCVEGGNAVAKQVKTGIQGENLIQIVSGLVEGAEVVTGSYRAISKDLVNGARVTVSKEPLRETVAKTP